MIYIYGLENNKRNVIQKNETTKNLSEINLKNHVLKASPYGRAVCKADGEGIAQ